MKEKVWTVELTEDPDTGDLVMELPDEVCELLGVELFDDVEISQNPDGSLTITKA